MICERIAEEKRIPTKMMILNLQPSTSFLFSLGFIVLIIQHVAAAPGTKKLPFGIEKKEDFAPPGQVVRTTVPALDKAALSAQDAKRGKDEPYRFAVPFPVNVQPTPAEWKIQGDGSAMWRHVARAEGANSINLGFEKFDLPPGVDLFIYTTDNKVVRGPYNHESTSSGEIWTNIFQEYDEVVVELDAEKGVDLSAVKLALTSLNSGYRPFPSKKLPKGTGGKGQGRGRKLSGSCNVDVVCSQGNAWRNEVRQYKKYIALRFTHENELNFFLPLLPLA